MHWKTHLATPPKHSFSSLSPPSKNTFSSNFTPQMEYPSVNMYEDNSNTNNTSEDNNYNIIVNGNPVKKTRGRQKIPMRKIEKDSDKMITFSKWRSGVY
ncbi:hypothetical protein LINPERHAP2_LOCUS4506 [Linum perenne]